jgi:hypothetical protein
VHKDKKEKRKKEKKKKRKKEKKKKRALSVSFFHCSPPQAFSVFLFWGFNLSLF